jgi:hypothetical protein
VLFFEAVSLTKFGKINGGIQPLKECKMKFEKKNPKRCATQESILASNFGKT